VAADYKFGRDAKYRCQPVGVPPMGGHCEGFKGFQVR
jgi:hypothetical protein